MGTDRPPPASKRLRTASPAPRQPLKVGLVGLGAIGGYVAEALAGDAPLPGAQLAAALVQRPRGEGERPAGCGPDVVLTNDVEAFFAADWTLCVEAAGQPWLRLHARRVLEAGRSLLVTSVGVLTDDALHRELVDTAAASGAQLLIAAGAMPGMDWMSSAAIEQVDDVSVTQRKRPEGWLGTPAEAKVDLHAITEPTIVFEGTAREAASQFPKNANISAALALATVGLDSLRVQLVADPLISGPNQKIYLKGAAGEISIEVKGAALSQRTSRVVPLSVVKALRNLSSPEAIGV